MTNNLFASDTNQKFEQMSVAIYDRLKKLNHFVNAAVVGCGQAENKAMYMTKKPIEKAIKIR